MYLFQHILLVLYLQHFQLRQAFFLTLDVTQHSPYVPSHFVARIYRASNGRSDPSSACRPRYIFVLSIFFFSSKVTTKQQTSGFQTDAGSRDKILNIYCHGRTVWAVCFLSAIRSCYFVLHFTIEQPINRVKSTTVVVQ